MEQLKALWWRWCPGEGGTLDGRKPELEKTKVKKELVNNRINTVFTKAIYEDGIQKKIFLKKDHE